MKAKPCEDRQQDHSGLFQTRRVHGNGFIEAFNSKLGAGCLNAHCFLTQEEAREKLERLRRDYNEDHLYLTIGYIVPIGLHNPGGVTGTPLA
ncbi:integrase core domain-containing protein [Brucella pituitosa]|uniref:integrase core domain-containing protein n=1 Tax=Brucella pituitosa TaxID=571256 RepID=UPI003F4ABBBA